MTLSLSKLVRKLTCLSLLLCTLPTTYAQGGNGNGGSLCTADAGTISIEFDAGCLVNGEATVTATPDGNAVVPAGYSLLYVLTQTNGLIIQAVSATPTFTVNSLDIHRIHTLVYDPATLDLSVVQFGETSAYDIFPLLIAGGGTICAGLDVSGAPFKVQDCPCEADAGTISIEFDAGCLVNGEATVTATPDGNAVVPAGYSLLYVLTQTNGLIIQAVNTTPTFTVNSLDIYRIHTLVYDPATLDLSVVQFGETSAYDIFPLLIAGGGTICASLDVSGAPFKLQECENQCTADAGTISADQPDQCLVDGSATLMATPTGNSTVPNGYSVLYVLTRGAGLIIDQVSTVASFNVNAAGLFTIHTLVYDAATLDLSIVVFGETTGVDVNALLIQGGGTICAALDVIGAEFQVADCPPPCLANAGTISANAADLCLISGEAVLEATPNSDQTVPSGYSVLYVLTQGTDLVIRQVSMAPSFTVTDAGQYTIHTLVYDPATLDLSTVVFGQTTGFDVNALLIQGGGTICAALDVAGAEFQVADCTPVCSAFAGTMTPDIIDEVCLVNGSAFISATPNEDAVVPAGFSVVYLLGMGLEGTVMAIGEAPEFTVTTGGGWSVNRFVYDPTTFDIASIQIGVSWVLSLHQSTIEAGGGLCASVSWVGMNMFTTECTDPCTAFAGTVTQIPDACLFLVNPDVPFYTYVLVPTRNGDAIVPAGPQWQQTYLLTSGTDDIIDLVDPVDEFFFHQPGSWTLHTLLYNWDTFDPNSIIEGETTITDLNTVFIQGGGAICGSLDVSGMTFNTLICCTSDAGIGGDRLLCFNDPIVDLFSLLTGTPDAGGNWTGPNGMAFGGTFDPTTDMSGIYVYAVQDGPDCPTDTTQLVIDVIECPNVTGATPEKWTDTESVGTATAVGDELGFTTLLLWPNPALEVVSVSLPFVPSQRARIELMDGLGRTATVAMTFTGSTLQLDVRSIAAGAWVLRIVDGEHTALARFVHAQR
jgi:hypothetical protein